MKSFETHVLEKEINETINFLREDKKLYSEQFNLFCEVLGRNSLNENFYQQPLAGDRNLMSGYVQNFEQGFKDLVEKGLGTVMQAINSTGSYGQQVSPEVEKQMKDQLRSFYGKLKEAVVFWNQFKKVVNQNFPKYQPQPQQQQPSTQVKQTQPVTNRPTPTMNPVVNMNQSTVGPTYNGRANQ